MSPRIYSSARDRILDAAERLIRARGVGQLSVEAVAKEAEVSKGGFFHHFASKDELLVALLDRLVEQVGVMLKARAAQDPEPRGALLRAQVAMAFDLGPEAFEQFISLILAFLQLATAQPGLFQRAQQINAQAIARDEAQGIPAGNAIAIQFALDGYGLAKGIGSSQLSPKQEAAFREVLMSLAQPVSRPSRPSKKRRTS